MAHGPHSPQQGRPLQDATHTAPAAWRLMPGGAVETHAERRRQLYAELGNIDGQVCSHA